MEMRLPQELLAESLWIEDFCNKLTLKRIEELLQRHNLKLKKGKTLNDAYLAFGRGLKNAMGESQKAIEQIAEEIDKVCIIARWDFAIEKYSK